MVRLSRATVESIHSRVGQPSYLEQEPGSGILHFGIGQFAKGHLLAYTDALLNEVLGDWRVTGVSLKTTTAKDALAPQDFLYGLVSQSETGSEARVIGSLADIISLSDGGAEQLQAALQAPETKIVSLTITEKGYYQRDGKLDLSHPDIQADLRQPQSPATAIGWLAFGAWLRWQQGVTPFTVVSLDNLRGNGPVLRQVVIDYCAHVDADLASFVEAEVAFPASMVDRIVPALDLTARQLAEQQLGVRDSAPVVTETFTQWVLEDNFCSGRPAWERVGVLLCDDISVYETMKLRLLNGAHSTMAYWGLILGLETVADCMAQPSLRAYIEALLHAEVLPEVEPPPGIELHAYISGLIKRFSNPHLRHRCEQIAMDGSQKIPLRLLPVIEARLGSGKDIDLLAHAIAAWIMFLQGQEAVQDPLSDQLLRLAAVEPPEQMVAGLIAESGIFGETLPRSSLFHESVTNAVLAIRKLGPDGALGAMMEKT